MKTAQPQDVVELLTQMVRIESVSSGVSGNPDAECELADYLESLARAWGFETVRFPVEGGCSNLLVTCETSPDRPWALLDSHMDTVGVEGMTVDPFGAEIQDQKLYGRGSCDTKGSGAAMLWALREYARQPQRAGNVAILFSVDEEVGMTGIRSFLKNDLPGLGWRPWVVIVGEPTLLHPVVAHNGVVRWKLSTFGIAAHSSAPYLGQSAISRMGRVIRAVEDDYIDQMTAEHALTGRAACTITRIQGGTGVNVVPAFCELEIDRRTVPGEDREAVLPAVAKVVEPLKARDPDLRIEQRVTADRPALAPESSVEVLATVQAVLAELSLATDPMGAPFATHGGYTGEAGLPTIVLGPGDPLPAHTKAEYIDLSQLRQGAAVYQGIMNAYVDGEASN